MVSAKKLTDHDKTSEYVLPESIKKAAVASLKQEQSKLAAEIDRTREESQVRQQDENTRVFNLRKLQLEDKLRELEERKRKSEKELQLIQQQKNYKLHDDLRKVGKVLVQEIRKITPLEKELGTGTTQLQALLGELRQVLDLIAGERQQEKERGEGLAQEMHFLRSTLEEMNQLLNLQLVRTFSELQPLLEEKTQLTTSISQLKLEQSRVRDELHAGASEKSEVAARVMNLRQEVHHLEGRASELRPLLATQQELEQKLLGLRQETAGARTQLEGLEAQLLRAREAQAQCEEKLWQKEAQLRDLTQQVSWREARLTELKVRASKLTEEVEEKQHRAGSLQQELAELSAKKASAELDVDQLRHQRDVAQKLSAEAEEHLQEKKALHQGQLALLEESHQHRLQALEEEFARRREERSREFDAFTQQDLRQHEQALQRQLEQHIAHQRLKIQWLLDETIRLVKPRLQPGSTSSEERTEILRQELAVHFERYCQSPPSRLWDARLWMASTTALLAVSAVLAWKVLV